MIVLDENEKKYLLTDIRIDSLWDKEHLVYQWYIDVSETMHTKEKIIFDFLQTRVIYVRIKKRTDGLGRNKKEVTYLNIDSFDPYRMIDILFVMKRRHIKGKLFLDRMLRSNGVCDYLLEDEGNEIDSYNGKEFRIVRDVTDDMRFYNQNMCIPFTKEDADNLNFLLQLF